MQRIKDLYYDITERKTFKKGKKSVVGFGKAFKKQFKREIPKKWDFKI